MARLRRENNHRRPCFKSTYLPPHRHPMRPSTRCTAAAKRSRNTIFLVSVSALFALQARQLVGFLNLKIPTSSTVSALEEVAQENPIASASAVVQDVTAAESATTNVPQSEPSPQQQQQQTPIPFPTDHRADKELTTKIAAMSLGWGNTTLSRTTYSVISELCPDVVAHFNRFPSFVDPLPVHDMPYMTTPYAATTTCLVQMTRVLAASLQIPFLLHAGSQLGALAHGQPIPWDDDADALIPFGRWKDLHAQCEGDGIPLTVVHNTTVRLQCVQAKNALKVWLHIDGMPKTTHADYPWHAPFLDLFVYKVAEQTSGEVLVQEVSPGTGQFVRRNHKSFAYEDVFPAQPYYFGGVYTMGPNQRLASKRYQVHGRCVTAVFNHRLQIWGNPEYGGKRIDCNVVRAMGLPFVEAPLHDSNTTAGSNMRIHGGTQALSIPISATAPLYPPPGVPLQTTIAQRKEWFPLPPKQGQELTDALKPLGLDTVDVDNSISTSCHELRAKKHMQVVEFNAERGKWWLDAAIELDVLKNADVIVLNEMDIGMARSGHLHTTRAMAQLLGMNYAWGVEFVELTLGDADDIQHSTEPNSPNLYGLHGNAILARCPLIDPIILRNGVGPYFSDTPAPVNANGLEKRLGGRMGLLARMLVDTTDPPQQSMVLGSVHKLGGFRKEIRAYIGNASAVIAGDQPKSFCRSAGLRLVNPPEGSAGNTWPASCESFGKGRGDNICTNMVQVGEERTTKPCYEKFGLKVKLGDHSLTDVALEMPSSLLGSETAK